MKTKAFFPLKTHHENVDYIIDFRQVDIKF